MAKKETKKEEATVGKIEQLTEDKPTSDTPDIMAVLQSVANGMESLTTDMAGLKKRMHDVETGGADKFKYEAKEEDIAHAQQVREGLDPKVSKLVDEMLGADFGAEMKPLGDRPGFRFSVIVPERLSDNVVDKRPVNAVDADGNKTGKYVQDEGGNTKFEDYIPEDRRSRIMSSTDSYDAVKKHCEKVRGYIVAEFQKTNKPLPEFRVI